MSVVREDLLHLSPEALAQIANLGLVKRAARELESGKGPALAVGDDGTLRASFPDGLEVRWPPEVPIADVRCSCGAAGVCRHRVMAALAYRQSTEQAPPPISSPAGAGDEDLARLLPPRLLARAEAQRAAGLSIEIRTQAAGEPCPTARLPAATVRFWGGAAIETARCDCVTGTLCEHVALAVWAFRQAGDAETGVAQIRLGEVARAVVLDRAPYLALIESLLMAGVRHGGAQHAPALSFALDAAAVAKATWLQLLLADLETWFGAYAARSAGYRAADGYRLLAELALRLAAGARPGNAKAALGIGEAQETELDALRLISLGCRLEREGDEASDTWWARVILADIDTASRFVLDHRWRENAGRAPDLVHVRVAPGVKLQQLASGQLLSRNARRRADGSLLLGKARSAQNSLLPQSGDWSMLVPPLAFRRVAELRAEKASMPIPQIEPRHAAASFTVFHGGDVASVFYDPHHQTVAGVLHDAEDEPLILRLTHREVARHALDAAAGALSGRFGPLRHVAGTLSWQDGLPVLEPWAFVCDRLVVPDAEPSCGALAQLPLGEAESPQQEGVPALLARLEDLLAECLHLGLRNLTGSWRERVDALLIDLRAMALMVLAESLESHANAVRQAQANPADNRLAEDFLHLAVLATLHGEAYGATRLQSGRTQTATE